MRLHIRSKIFLVILLCLVLGLCSILFIIYPLVETMAVKEERQALYRQANYIAASYRANIGNVNKGQIEAMAYDEEATIRIIDIEGTILLSSGSDTQTPTSVPSFNPALGIDGYYQIDDFYGTFHEEMLTVYAPLAKDVLIRGYVLIHKPMRLVKIPLNRSMSFVFLLFVFMGMLFLLLYLYLYLRLIRPIEKIAKAGLEFANGNRTYPLSVQSKDELHDIALSEIDLSKQLSETSDDQHKFMANISHDFRSPLTSIRGYIVAMQDGTIPAEMQDKYFHILLDETDRLMNLSNNILDITELEGNFLLQKTVFDINDFIRKMLLSFEGRALEKSLTFELTFESESQEVYADKARIEQVLHNLIDNGIKFSNPNSTLDIATRKAGDKVFISVRDHGIGIAKENLAKIWNRFYKIDSSRGKDKKGSGLGLSIVREIIQAHKENIDCISTEGAGAEFIFTLPISKESRIV